MYREWISIMIDAVKGITHTAYNVVDDLDCLHYVRYYDILTPKQNLLMFHKKWRVAKKWRRKYDKVYEVRSAREKQLLKALGLYMERGK